MRLWSLFSSTLRNVLSMYEDSVWIAGTFYIFWYDMKRSGSRVPLLCSVDRSARRVGWTVLLASGTNNTIRLLSTLRRQRVCPAVLTAIGANPSDHIEGVQGHLSSTFIEPRFVWRSRSGPWKKGQHQKDISLLENSGSYVKVKTALHDVRRALILRAPGIIAVRT